MTAKRCSGCEKLLPFDHFGPHRGRHDRLQPICRPCKRTSLKASKRRIIKRLRQDAAVIDLRAENRGQGRQAAPDVAPQRFRRTIPKSLRYIIAAAQNASPVKAAAWAALKVAAKRLEAHIIIIPQRYKNPTSIWTADQEGNDWWAPELVQHLFDGRHHLNRNLVVVGDVKVQPTASNPLAGFESLTHTESMILGHPRFEAKVVPAALGRWPKWVHTTASITVPTYGPTKAGAIGEFHHVTGALLAEVDPDGGAYRLWTLNCADDGSFIHQDMEYTPTGARKAPPALGLVLGDVHARFFSKQVDKATFGSGGIVDVLRPRWLLANDTNDGYSVNPHHEGNVYTAIAKYKAGFGDVRGEVEHAVQFLKDRLRPGVEGWVVVPSNHDDFLMRWVQKIARNGVAGLDLRTQMYWCKLHMAIAEATVMGEGGAEYPDPFVLSIEELRGDAPIRALRRGEPFQLGDIECGMHGDKGPRGTRGSRANLSRLGTRVIIGHGHSPGIREGAYQTGTCTPLELEYTRGSPSDWLNSHVITYANSKRAIITCIDGKWRL